ncbi:MAG: orotidine-5'-phosphate decarboxylase [Oscillospiraceae bacterium]|nr:orotidine-5'-phosphate decarboxylase [Oscillospiraceae bacterium]
MSVDILQEKIRKLKNPSVVDFTLSKQWLPPQVMEGSGSLCDAWLGYCKDMLQALKGTVPAVRFGFASFSLLGAAGIDALEQLLSRARELGYYILLDMPELLSPVAAKTAAEELAPWAYDGVVVSPYLGSDVLRPFVSLCKEQNKALFVVVRTSNKSAMELQDLMTGSRLVHSAVTDIVNRHGETMVGKSGYSQVAVVAGAGAPNSLKSLRSKYTRIFLLLDGYDYPSGNAKNCSYAFDRLGHGAAACACGSILGAWQEEGESSEDYTGAALRAAERMKKNLTRYITVL